MDFDLTSEQTLLAQTVNSFLERHYSSSSRMEVLGSDLGWSADIWRRFAEFGLLGLGIPAEYGGAGTGADELTAVVECFGRSLVLEPFVSTVVLGAGLVSHVGTASQKADILPRVAAGELLLAFASVERSSGWDVLRGKTEATLSAHGWTVSGEKIAVSGGDRADLYVVSARTREGVGLFLVDAREVARQSYSMQDGIRGADLLFTHSGATLLGEQLDATEAIRFVTDTAIVALCAEAIGAMSRMLELTLDHLRTRKQFGRPLASFQALQFRASDMYVALELSRSMLLFARLSLRSPDVATRRRNTCAAKAHIDQTSRLFAQESIQLHGGIGMTMEHPIGQYAKRITLIAKTFADVGDLVTSIGAAGGLIGADVSI
jgi:alkylation response protein AidB-like acyl-CoA dehydrogenase